MFINRGLALSSVSWSFENPRVPGYRGTYHSIVNQTTQVFPDCDFGEEAAGRLVAAAFTATAGAGRTVVEVTIGDVVATLSVSAGSGTNIGEMYHAIVPAGRRGQISIEWSSNTTTCDIHVFSLYPENSTPVDAIGSFSSGASGRVLTDLAKTAGGFAIVATRHATVGTTVTPSQTGVETILKPFDGNIANGTAAGCAMTFRVTETTTTDDFTATFSASAACNIVGATWV